MGVRKGSAWKHSSDQKGVSWTVWKRREERLKGVSRQGWEYLDQDTGEYGSSDGHKVLDREYLGEQQIPHE